MKKKFRKVAIGVDVGGSGIKGAPVDLKTGQFIDKRVRIPTPENAEPVEIAAIIGEIVDSFGLPDEVPVGVSFPAPIVRGQIPFIANLSQEWAGVFPARLIAENIHRPVAVMNDADAAGYAEVYYGAAKGHQGTVLMLTLGTGIGSALLSKGTLVPNTEFGHLLLPNGMEAEHFASSAVFEREELSFEQWAERLQMVFSHYEMLFSPDLFIVGGGVSKKHKKFLPLIDTNAPIVPADLLNTAGIVGSALYAKQMLPEE
ncbi:polyphosphate--glucose phosphotransferase [Trueperella pecoris]|uniref:polyphosphate--glucose phosphotransferase n=1 Tax=Trueperella pecoris TaxID=2733571 RepID=UPI00186B5FA8|nr:ROK family protein [Trueperella pecoris]QOQ38953.1 ROK family protein [Trueperella pecoris]QTG76244.1 ROK family protein [Trueperella pecoris]